MLPFERRLRTDAVFRAKEGVVTVDRPASLAAHVARGAPPPVEWIARLGGEPALALRPLRAPYRLEHRPVERPTAVRAARLASLRRDETGFLIESPLGAASVHTLSPQGGRLWLELGSAIAVPELAARLGAEEREVRSCLELLHVAALLEIGPEDPATRLWTHHEALFHARSRDGFDAAPKGATYRGRALGPAPPARRPPHPGTPVPFPSVGLDTATALDPPLGQVLERRRSVRDGAGRRPPSWSELGDVLFRAARTQRTLSQDGCERLLRPYPSGGAIGDLEIYLVCAGGGEIPRGAFHYDSHDHARVALGARSALIDQLLAGAGRAMRAGEPHVLLVITSRFARGLWAYEAIAYALVLKAVGALMQNLYLVAEARGLGACAIGMGNAAAFAELIGVPWTEEGSVGELALFGPRDDRR